MYEFFVITFTATGKRAVLRTDRHGELAVLDASGMFRRVDAIDSPYTSDRITFATVKAHAA